MIRALANRNPYVIVATGTGDACLLNGKIRKATIEDPVSKEIIDIRKA